MDLRRKALFHKIPTTDLDRQELKYNYSNIQLLATGRSAKVYSARHHKTDTELALKCIDKESTNKMDFFREFHYTYFLSPHPNIVNSFDVAFDTRKSFVFVQELASEGDLLKIVKNSSLTEDQTKSVVKQVSSALEFIHSKDLVHRDVCLENIFVYDKNFNKVKIGDFGQTKLQETQVRKADDFRIQWAPPEICQAVEKEKYNIAASQDAWQVGILIFVCMTGFFPWTQANIADPRYNEWTAWLKKKNPNIPQNFKYFSDRLLKLLKRLLNPKHDDRYGVKEVTKYLEDPWVVKGSGEIEIYYDEDLSVSFYENKPLRKVSTTSGSTSNLYGSCNSLCLKPRRDSNSRRSGSVTRRASIKRTSSASSITA